MNGAHASLRPMPPCINLLGDRAVIGAYHPGEHMRCTYCGGTHWLIGASTASCAGCEMPVPIVISVDHAMIPQIPTDERSAA